MKKKKETNKNTVKQGKISDTHIIEVNLIWICEALDVIEPFIMHLPTQRLNVNEEGHPWRKWFLMQALIELRKTIAALMIFKDQDFLRIEGELLVRNSLLRRMHYDLATGHTRKLKEVLARLIVMQGCDEDDYYHLYILAEEIRLKEAAVRETENLFGVRNIMMVRQFESLNKSFVTVLSRVDGSRINFLVRDKKGKILPKIKRENDLIFSALESVEPTERLALGHFYSSYMLESGRIHANFGVTLTADRDQNYDLMMHQCIVVASVALRIAMLLKLGANPKVAKLKRYFYSEIFKWLGTRSTNAFLKNGDIVEVLSHLGEVVSGKDGAPPLKYRLYQVRFFAKPLNSGVQTEWIPLYSIHPIMERREFIKLLTKHLKKMFPGKAFSKKEIERRSAAVLDCVKFSKRDENNISSVGTDHGRALFENFFGGSNEQGNQVIMRVFST